uniref:Obg domain-containing protein n=1 Tax=Corethron hystrix TaxID=216773 RepID=A0A7S1FQK5_9STRA|mmetsp:Transcript_23354/g.53299  ORF Transcript_23354/g.53299 Transcript_23354/m.53299 type:complete len:400 (+) Transcript_23354:177-1376(+)
MIIIVNALTGFPCLLLLLLVVAYPISAFPYLSGVERSLSHQQLAARKPPSLDPTSTTTSNYDECQQRNNHKDDPEWVFLDTARIHCQGGDGGSGCVPPPNNRYGKGGEEKRECSGGRGGKGGSVYLVCDDTLSSLVPMRQQVHFKAQSGKNGTGRNRDGAGGDDAYVKAPPGTLVRELKTQRPLGELHAAGDTLLLARGGRGASKSAEGGEKGEGRWLSVELRLLPDVGLVGMPNAGKSALLAATSGAAPRIAEYPFTTTGPNLGVCGPTTGDAGKGLVLCDLPGLIRGSSARGAGMGGAFLRHVELCPVLLHVVDGTSEDPVEDFLVVERELRDFGDGRLAQKPQVVVLNKSDVIPKERAALLVETLAQKARHSRVLSVSSTANENIQELVRQLYTFV